MCSVWTSEQTVIISLSSTNGWVPKTVCMFTARCELDFYIIFTLMSICWNRSACKKPAPHDWQAEVIQNAQNENVRNTWHSEDTRLTVAGGQAFVSCSYRYNESHARESISAVQGLERLRPCKLYIVLSNVNMYIIQQKVCICVINLRPRRRWLETTERPVLAWVSAPVLRGGHIHYRGPKLAKSPVRGLKPRRAEWLTVSRTVTSTWFLKVQSHTQPEDKQWPVIHPSRLKEKVVLH